MIRVDVVQGSEAWARLRLGLPTASQFNKIMSPVKLKFSDSAEGYVHDLLAEEMTGQSPASADTGFMLRGSALEVEAVEHYETLRDVEVDRVGFVLRDDRRVGCSPDGFVGDKGMAEFKCPEASNQVAFMLGADTVKYRCQTQGQLWLCEREWVDIESYNPTLPSVIVRIERDEPFIKALAGCVDRFLSYLDESRDKLIRRGYIKNPLALVSEAA